MTDAPSASRRVPDRRFPDGRFVNLHDATTHSLFEAWRWRATRRPPPWPAQVEVPFHPPPRRLGPGRIGATFIGHATWLLQVGGVAVLTDPVWSARASPLRFAGPRRVRAPGQALDALPRVDLLLVSHNHYDHLDIPTLRAIRRRWNPPALTPVGNAKHLARAGIEAVELDWWQAREAAGLRVTCTPAQHFSSRYGWDRDRDLWGGFVVEAPDGARAYFAGDSAWCPHFAEIGARFPGLDLALLPIGAYAPRHFVGHEHMNPEEAVQAHLALGARRSLGMHFGTFEGLTDEPWDEPPRRLEAARAAAGLAAEAFGVPEFGASRDWAAGG
ncbi:MBL fold metallo-hydrolase [Falsiroseomonas sp. CW058]|uniref:MBL fold metallo-hydrolase n=1 Tax=Falsiroseomonas sp. CW058 TaxID=3388664 RepID=UPI003D315B5D